MRTLPVAVAEADDREFVYIALAFFLSQPSHPAAAQPVVVVVVRIPIPVAAAEADDREFVYIEIVNWAPHLGQVRVRATNEHRA